MNYERDNVKNCPQTAEVSFLKTKLRKPSFRFLNFEVGLIFRKPISEPISEIFIGFCTSLLRCILRKQKIEIFKELITTTRATRVAFWDQPSGCKKVCIAIYGNPPQSYGASPATWDHTSVICHPTQVNVHHLNPSQPGQYSIYLPRRDGRLS